ncbi:MAG: hypothetical protein LBO63_01740 [Oscillospiraceae bacterium]|jgi:hypothetical protein|nr:hypothetical protein [Oscillospiraceae bacterium]
MPTIAVFIVILVIFIIRVVLVSASKTGSAAARRKSSAGLGQQTGESAQPPRAGAYPGANSGTSRPVTPVARGSYEPGRAHTTEHPNHDAHMSATRMENSSPEASRLASENYRSASNYSYATKPCPHCRKKMNILSKFCPNCGKDTL